MKLLRRFRIHREWKVGKTLLYDDKAMMERQRGNLPVQVRWVTEWKPT